MQKFRRVISILILSLLVVLNINYNVLAEESVSIKINTGFDGIYKYGNYTPINVEIANNIKDINGELQLGIVNDNGDTTLFAKEINLPKNSTKDITIDVPVMDYSSKKVYVKLIEGNKVYYEDFSKIKPGIRENSVLIGILSDKQDNVSYTGDLGNFNFSNNSVLSKGVQLDENIFPENNNTMESFDILIINDFDTSKFNEKQYSALKTWVNNGGTLIIGTGEAYNKTLGIFMESDDDYLVGKIGEVSRVNTSALHEFMSLGGNVEVMELDLIDLQLDKGVSMLEDNNSTIVQKIDKGKGTIEVLAFDLGLNPMANWEVRHSFVKKLIKEVYSGDLLSNSDRGYDKFNRIQNILANIPELPMPTAMKTIIIFIIYILLVSPISYLILKKRDKRELMWGVVPVLSIIFVVIMFVSGISTRVSTSVINSINYINVDKEGNKSIDSFASVLTPTKSDIKIDTDENLVLSPMIKNYHYGYSRSNNLTNLKVSDVNPTSKIMEGNKDYIEFYSNTVFSNNIVKVKNMVQEGNIACSLNFSDGMYSGKVTNKFDFDVSDSYILFNNNYIKIGDIKAGETKEVKIAANTYRGGIREFTEKVYRNNRNNANSSFMSAEEIKKIKFSRQKADFLNTYFEDTNNVESPKLISWANTDFNKGIIVNGKSIRKFEKSILITDANITFKSNGIAEYPYGFIAPKLDTSGNNAMGYDEYSKRFYETGNYEVSFLLEEKDINLEEINVKYSLTIFQSGGAKAAEQYIYNNKTGEWEEGDFRNYKIKKEDFDKYLDNNNELRFKLNILKNDTPGEIPKISVKGSVK
ncbi:hypothetical protein SH2C18_47800 [Clostridium sediminicola]|uniref:hypothetical protein n=1 Tax=Clostridium sediminicola TaxID=3114879 RepID=UPI0031F256A3